MPEMDTLAHLRAAAASIDHSAPLDKEATEEAVDLVTRLLLQLEPPSRTILRHAYFSPSQQACLRVGIDLSLFKTLAAAQPAAISTVDLAKPLAADPKLVIRVMRVLVSLGYARTLGPDQYAATPLAVAMTEPVLEATIRSCSEDTVQIAAKLPSFLRERQYRNPEDAMDSPFQYAMKETCLYFDWVAADAQRARDFNVSMAAMRTDGVHWTDWFPVQKEILDGAASAPTPLVVDVGGGVGHDLRVFLDRFPSTAGRLVLQDLPAVVAEAAPGSFDIQSHDFFTVQTVCGARVYFFHHVFHNWSDTAAVRILRNLLPALTPDYSMIILNESVLPDENCAPSNAAQDINMMCLLAGEKRSRHQFATLIRSVGLDLVRVWTSPYKADEAIL